MQKVGEMKKLPIGIQTFSEIREDNYIYIDKTKFAYNLINNYKYAFLSRPRRFGKSLFLDTLSEIFKANKKYFEGLYIYDKWDWEKKYPVIKISFTNSRSSKELIQNILKSLESVQKELDISCKEDYSYSICFADLIQKAYEKYNQKVVVLIDEYDKAILDNLDQIEVAKENREILKSLYTQIKDNDRYIKFAFLTGVSKFFTASIFSGLNNLEDISLKPRFGDICGYTQADIDNEFKEYLVNVDKGKLKKWYNGYNFLGNKIYNPFDVLLFIKNDFKFDNYWFNTGTPSFLVKLFKKERYNLAEFEELRVSSSLIDAFDIEYINLETVLFQSGYLTIKEEIERRNRIEYILTYPNMEVKISFNDYILNFLVENRAFKYKIQDRLIDVLENGDLEGLKEVFSSLFASIAYHNFTNNYISSYEGFYASVIYAYFVGAGFDEVKAEDVTNSGRIDLSIFLDKKVFIFEFKVDSVVGVDALEQIKEKEYYKKYLNSCDEIYIIGVEFDSKERNITRFEWEKIK